MRAWSVTEEILKLLHVFCFLSKIEFSFFGFVGCTYKAARPQNDMVLCIFLSLCVSKDESGYSEPERKLNFCQMQIRRNETASVSNCGGEQRILSSLKFSTFTYPSRGSWSVWHQQTSSYSTGTYKSWTLPISESNRTVYLAEFDSKKLDHFITRGTLIWRKKAADIRNLALSALSFSRS